jgi:ankyrin repeat protein
MNTYPMSFPNAVVSADPDYAIPQSPLQPGGSFAAGRPAIMAPSPVAFAAAPVVYAGSAAVGNEGSMPVTQAGLHRGSVAGTVGNPRYRSDRWMISPLCRAAYTGDIDTVLTLLQHGCAVNAWEQGEARAYTPLIAAAENGHTDIVELLIGAGADVKLSNGQDRSALYCAATNGHTDIVILLLQQDDIRAEERMLDGSAAFCRAAVGGHAAAAEVLLDNSTVSFRSRQECLVTACHRGDIAIVDLLFRRGGLGLGELDGNSCLHLAAARGRTALVTWLLGCGVDANASGAGNLTPLQHACLGGHVDVVGQLLAHLGLNVNDPALSPTPLLYLAIEAGHLALMQYLLRAGALLNAYDLKTGRTGLMAAAAKGRVDMLQTLLARGDIKLDLVCHSGWTALQLATFSGGRDAAICLLNGGAPVAVPNDFTYRHSLLWRAVERKDGELFRLMLKRANIGAGHGAPFFNAAWSHAAQSGCADIVECMLYVGLGDDNSPDLVRQIHQASDRAGHGASVKAIMYANAHHASVMAAGRPTVAGSEYTAMMHGLEHYVPAIVGADLRFINTTATGFWPSVTAQSVSGTLDAPVQLFEQLIAPTGSRHLAVECLRESLLLHLHGQRLLLAVALPVADCLAACANSLALLGGAAEKYSPQQSAMYYAAALSALNPQDQAGFASRLYSLAKIGGDDIKRLTIASQGQFNALCTLAGKVATQNGELVQEGILPACMGQTNARYEVDVVALADKLFANGLTRLLAQVVATCWNASVTALMATPLVIPPCATFFHVTQIIDNALRRLGQTHFAARLLAALSSLEAASAPRHMSSKPTGDALPMLFKCQVDQLRGYCDRLRRS